MLSSQAKVPPRAGVRAARRELNTKKILDAAIRCLNKHSYADTTLALIATTAGVSRGQVQNIFGVKRTDLLARIATEIFERYFRHYSEAIDAARTPAQMAANVWDAMYDLSSRPETLALVDLWLGTRNDRPFHRKLREMMLPVDNRLRDKWVRLFREHGLNADRVDVIRVYQRSLMRGLAVERQVVADDALFKQIADEARQAFVRMVEQSVPAR